MVINQEFFSSKSTIRVARELLGKFLVRRYRGKTRAYMITDVEAYDGWKDKASHAHHGRTERNAPMFGEAGHWYVYFTYGMHWLLNIVTGPQKYPAAILIRSIRIVGPEPSRRTAFNGPEHGRGATINGPARLTKALHIDKKLNGKKADKKSSLWIEKRGAVKLKIKKGPRIGVDYAGPIWSKKHCRFYL